MKIGIDIDDVLADSLPYYTRAFNQRFGLQIDLADAAWRIFDRFPWISRQEAHDFFSELIEAGFFSSPRFCQGPRRLWNLWPKTGITCSSSPGARPKTRRSPRTG